MWETGALERTVNNIRPKVAEVRGMTHDLESHIQVAVQRLSRDPDLQDARNVRDRLFAAIEIIEPSDRTGGIAGKLREQFKELDEAITRVEELS